MHKEPSIFRRILIVQTAFIGDVILITPLIRAVHELYPDALIDVMVVPAAAGLLRNNPHIHEIIKFDKHGSHFSFIRCAIALRKAHYDLVISPHSSFTTHLMLRLSSAPIRIGYKRGFLSEFLMTDRVVHPKGIHKINKNLSMLKLLSDKEFPMQTELFPGEDDRSKADALLAELGSPEKTLIAIAPGSIWATKCWNLDYYKQLTLSLLNAGYRILMTGGDSDKDRCAAILDHVRRINPDFPIMNTAGRSGLLTSAALIDQAELLICNDSGALHIGNAMRTRVFAFFGPTVQRIGYYPFREGDIVFETDLECRPCGSHGGNRCPLGHHNCMNLITPDKVLEKALKALNFEGTPHE